MNYFRKLEDLLKIERNEDQEQYKEIFEKYPVAVRKTMGLCWYPIAIRGTEMSRGDYLTVEVERTTNTEIAHQLRFGMPAALFSNHDAKQLRVEGVISHVNRNFLKITLKTDELPEWSRDGKLGIDLLFDDNSYSEMFNALKTASIFSEKGGLPLLDVLTGTKTPEFDHGKFSYASTSLNDSQIAAVQNIIDANQLAIVHGPPGTGKTTTLIAAIKALIKQDNKQILVTAPSNTAVDLLCEKLSLEGLKVLRIGNPVRVSERLQELTLESRMAAHPRMKDVKVLKKQANEYRNMAHKYKRSFGRAEREQRKALFDEAHKILKEVNNTEQYITDDLIGKSQVIAATLVGANHYTVERLKYETVVIDEAGQAIEPACWIPILKGRKLIMAGDHQQLPPTIKSSEAAKLGLSTTLFEKCIEALPESVVMLDTQYRMHEKIMQFSSQTFYNNQLKAHESVAKHLVSPNSPAFQFIDTAGCGFEEKLEGTSSTNPEEAAFLVKFLFREIASLLPDYSIENFPTIAVISPYKQQVAVLAEYIQGHELATALGNKISVNTIDSFQGQERDMVFISMTRSNAEGGIGFLSDTRRMNVAMTRARKKLVIAGDSATLSRLPFYASLIQYAEENDGYFSAWEFV